MLLALSLSVVAFGSLLRYFLTLSLSLVYLVPFLLPLLIRFVHSFPGFVYSPSLALQIHSLKLQTDRSPVICVGWLCAYMWVSGWCLPAIASIFLGVRLPRAYLLVVSLVGCFCLFLRSSPCMCPAVFGFAVLSVSITRQLASLRCLCVGCSCFVSLPVVSLLCALLSFRRFNHPWTFPCRPPLSDIARILRVWFYLRLHWFTWHCSVLITRLLGLICLRCCFVVVLGFCYVCMCMCVRCVCAHVWLSEFCVSPTATVF